jgi:hypothetical protein
MTFRIDAVHENACHWHWEIKGLGGQGIYCALETNAEGRGLYLLDRLEQQPILAPEIFSISHGAGKAEANCLLAQALNGLGWGPQVDQRGEIIS